MNKIATFFRRLASGSLGRLKRNIDMIHQESGKSRVLLFFDIVYCIFAYGVGYLDYLTFGFAYIKRDKRKTFMTMDDNIALVRRLNDRDYYCVFDDKLNFVKKFKKYLKRDILDLHDGLDAFRSFCEGKKVIFAKQPVSFGGLGVQKIDLAAAGELSALYQSLIEKKMFLVEEAIVQHPRMNELCDRSINTVRIVTILNDRGEARFVYALIRIGNGKTDVDNITSGGMYTLVDPDGTISNPMFCDKTVSYYESHPYSGKVFRGFQIPYFEEAVAMCKEAASVEPHMRYIGWDVGITPDGPLLVEGNNLPGYDMCQNHRFHSDGCGIKAAFEAAINS